MPDPVTTPPVTILVDADACPVKDEIYRVAERHGAHVRVVSNQAFRVPVSARVKRVVVGGNSGSHGEPQGRTPAGRLGRKPSWAGSEAEPAEPGHPQRPASEGPKFDAADDWIAAHAGPRTLVVTGDILLADRALKAGASVLAHTGKPFDAASIGSAPKNTGATRAIMADLRAGMDGPLGGSGGGPPPFRKEGVGAEGGDGQRPPARSRFLQALDRELVRLGRVRD